MSDVKQTNEVKSERETLDNDRVINAAPDVLETLEAAIRYITETEFEDSIYAEQMSKDNPHKHLGNRFVEEDFAPNRGKFSYRIAALIPALDKLKPLAGHMCKYRAGGDTVGIWRSQLTYKAVAYLYGGDGTWKAEGGTAEQAIERLREKLIEAERILR